MIVRIRLLNDLWLLLKLTIWIVKTFIPIVKVNAHEMALSLQWSIKIYHIMYLGFSSFHYFGLLLLMIRLIWLSLSIHVILINLYNFFFFNIIVWALLLISWLALRFMCTSSKEHLFIVIYFFLSRAIPWFLPASSYSSAITIVLIERAVHLQPILIGWIYRRWLIKSIHLIFIAWSYEFILIRHGARLVVVIKKI